MSENNKEFSNVHKVALLVSIACVLQIAESVIPHPIPGLRLGLANVITLIAMVMLGFGCAMEVTLLRTILGSLMMGTFMSPTFILSFCAGIVSVAIMGVFYRLIRFGQKGGLSIVGISILGALAHNITQLYLAYMMLVKHPGIWVFLPWLCVGSVITGWLTGVVAGRVCINLKRFRARETGSIGLIGLDGVALRFSHYVPGSSLIHRLTAEMKITGSFLLALSVLIFDHLWCYVGMGLFFSIIVAQSRIPFSFLCSTVRKCYFMIAVSFLFPLFFNSGTHVVLDMNFVKITTEGFCTGAVVAYRIFLLMLLSALLVRTTSPGELGRGLSKLLAPLKVMGISGERVARIFSLSWMAIPVFWDIAKEIVRGLDRGRGRDWSKLIRLASDFITRFYLEAEGAFACRRIDNGF